MDPCFQSKEFHSLSREVIDNKERTAEKEVPRSFQLGLPRMEEIKTVFAWGSDFRTQVQTSKAHCLTPISPLEAQETQSAKPRTSILRHNTSGRQHSPAWKSKKVGSGRLDRCLHFYALDFFCSWKSLSLALQDYIFSLGPFLHCDMPDWPAFSSHPLS